MLVVEDPALQFTERLHRVGFRRVRRAAVPVHLLDDIKNLTEFREQLRVLVQSQGEAPRLVMNASASFLLVGGQFKLLTQHK